MWQNAMEAQFTLSLTTRGIRLTDITDYEELQKHAEGLELGKLMESCDLTGAIQTALRGQLEKTTCDETRELLQKMIENIKINSSLRYGQTLGLEGEDHDN